MARKPKTKAPYVAVLIDTGSGWGRLVIRGITSYMRKYGPWYLWVETRGHRAPIRLPTGWHGQGIIARVADPAMARHVAATGLPVVNISSVPLSGVNLPRVMPDLRASARLAAEHLLDRGFRHFAYCGPQSRSYLAYHRKSFAETLAEVGYECLIYQPSRGAGATAPWHVQQQDMIDWLQRLPKPVGIVTWATQRGYEVIHACRQANLLVPEQVAVLGADEDELICEMCAPPLSGIALTSERLGYEAAALLDRLMQGRRPPKRPILIKPTGVVTRQSTDTLAIEDQDLARAVAFIRSHAVDPIGVEDVLREVPVSRSWLERRFREVFGRTPGAEICRVRLERAKALLTETDMSIPEIAAAAGYKSREYLAYAFKLATGSSPAKYRSSACVR